MIEPVYGLVLLMINATFRFTVKHGEAVNPEMVTCRR